MGTYSRELKEQLVKKLLVEGGPSVAALSRETGVGESTLFAWRKRLREECFHPASMRAPSGRQQASSTRIEKEPKIAETEAEIQSLTERLADLKRIQRSYTKVRRTATRPRSCCSLLVGLPEEKRFARSAVQ